MAQAAPGGDRRLVGRSRGGDPTDFAQLMRQHGSLVRHLATVYVGTEDASDAAQEIWLTVFRKLATLEDDLQFVPWLHSVAFHKCLDFRRRRARQQRGEVHLAPEDWRRLAECVVDDATALDQALEHREVRQHVLAELDCLPDHLALVLRMRLVGEMPYTEIAAAARIPVSTLKWRLNQARRLLRMRLALMLRGNRGKES